MTKIAWAPILAVLVGAGAWGVIWYPLRLCAAAGLSGLWLALALYGGGACLGLLAFGRRLTFRGPPWLWPALAVLGGVTNIGFVIAVLHDDVLRVTLLFYLAPVWSVLAARLFLKEPLSVPVLAGAVLAIAGAVILLWHHASLALTDFDVVALVAGVAFAGANVLLRAHPGLALEAKVFATLLGVLIVGVAALPFAASGWPAVHPEIVWLAAAAGGGLAILAITWLVQYGVTALPVRQSAVLLLFEVVTAGFSRHLLLRGALGLHALIGGAVIAAGATLVAAFGS